MRYILITTADGYLIAIPKWIVHALDWARNPQCYCAACVKRRNFSTIDARTLIQLPGAFFPKRVRM